MPKVNTPLLEDLQNGSFKMLSPHEVIEETALLISGLKVSSCVVSDHYTNYINLSGKLPEEKTRLLEDIKQALKRDEKSFRPFFVGEQ